MLEAQSDREFTELCKALGGSIRRVGGRRLCHVEKVATLRIVYRKNGDADIIVRTAYSGESYPPIPATLIAEWKARYRGEIEVYPPVVSAEFVDLTPEGTSVDVITVLPEEFIQEDVATGDVLEVGLGIRFPPRDMWLEKKKDVLTIRFGDWQWKIE